MARYADLDRRRKEHILVNQHANLLAIDALSKATGYGIEHWMKEIALRANAHVDNCNDAQINAVIAQLDSQYDSTK